MRKYWIILLLILAFAITFFIAGPYVADSITNRLISDLLEEYKTNPTQDICNKLARALDSQAVETELGNEILKELATPILNTRSAYSVDKPVYFSLTRRFSSHFSNMKISSQRNVDTVDGENMYHSGGGGGNNFGTNPRFYRYRPQPEKPGDYKLQVRYRYELIPNPPKSVNGVPTNTKQSEEAVYQCEFTIPVELKVVPKEHADFVTPVSSPGLDAKMKAAFFTRTLNQSASYGTPSGRRESTASTVISYKNCPLIIGDSHLFFC